MPKVIYQSPDGALTEIDAPVGATVRNLALANGVDGIVGECGGELMCASCHVYVDEQFLERLPPVQEEEDEMLESTACERLSNSRLSCQIKMTDELDGLLVRLPEEQL
ncbi:MAG: 2Fe-2S iron-sulfur cluster binding domain-containing protein [Solirubrobacterales bacterium]|nr:2Fe-2S iron-sulfur cluster binding domain-containing protein [Solirubrobacterales bacterium]MBV9471788.1 2Fe-2S iron-sulfur cluster binding domain-containing protein [Solirubrobacterales bacterium]